MVSTQHQDMIEERKSVNYAKFLADMNERQSVKMNQQTRDISTEDQTISLDAGDETLRENDCTRPSVNEHYGFYQNTDQMSEVPLDDCISSQYQRSSIKSNFDNEIYFGQKTKSRDLNSTMQRHTVSNYQELGETRL